MIDMPATTTGCTWVGILVSTTDLRMEIGKEATKDTMATPMVEQITLIKVWALAGEQELHKTTD